MLQVQYIHIENLNNKVELYRESFNHFIQVTYTDGTTKNLIK